MLRGLENKQIAARLDLSEFTVKEYLQTVYRKAGVRTGRQFMAFLLGTGADTAMD
jgi:DNA-binding NarL/FixJ family response regulator